MVRMGAEGSKSASDSMFCLERLPCLVCEWVLNKLVITGLGVIEMAMAGRRYNGSILVQSQNQDTYSYTTFSHSGPGESLTGRHLIILRLFISVQSLQ